MGSAGSFTKLQTDLIPSNQGIVDLNGQTLNVDTLQSQNCHLYTTDAADDLKPLSLERLFRFKQNRDFNTRLTNNQ